MYIVKQLYTIYEDGCGHKYLIPKDEYGKFNKAYARIEESYECHNNEDIYYEELEGLLESFSVQTLEGESHYIVLEEHIKEKTNV